MRIFFFDYYYRAVVGCFVVVVAVFFRRADDDETVEMSTPRETWIIYDVIHDTLQVWNVDKRVNTSRNRCSLLHLMHTRASPQ